MKAAARHALRAYFVAAALYVGYAWYTYTGLYRLAAELQMQMFGAYSLKMTFLAPFVVLMIPGAVIARVFGLRRKPVRGAGAAASSSSAASSSPPTGMALIGVLLLVVATGAGWLGYQKSVDTQRIESVDLSQNGEPASTHVVMTGVARTEYILEIRDDGWRDDDHRQLCPADAGRLAPWRSAGLFPEDRCDRLLSTPRRQVLRIRAGNPAVSDDHPAGGSGQERASRADCRHLPQARHRSRGYSDRA